MRNYENGREHTGVEEVGENLRGAQSRIGASSGLSVLEQLIVRIRQKMGADCAVQSGQVVAGAGD